MFFLMKGNMGMIAFLILFGVLEQIAANREKEPPSGENPRSTGPWVLLRHLLRPNHDLLDSAPREGQGCLGSRV